MIDFNSLLKENPFAFLKEKKEKFFLSNQKRLTFHHYKNSKEYKKITDFGFKNFKRVKNIDLLPYVHTKLFKLYNLKSVNEKKITTLKSSGTSGTLLSKINIDFKTSLIQASVLKKIIFNFIPNHINTIIIIDSEKNFNDTKNFNARKAAIRGFAQYFKNKIFLLDSKNNLNIKKIQKIKKNLNNEHCLYFGFTDIVWDNFVQVLKKKKIKFKKNKNYLVHGGGWKKLENRKIKKKIFNSEINKILSLKRIINYYGMIEQTGSIFMECDYGYFHTSIFSEILVRDANFELEQNSKAGIIQVFSLLPVSYPGHNIVTEDIGIIIGEDNCKCGRKGKYFKILGRVKDTEVRGCANV